MNKKKDRARGFARVAASHMADMSPIFDIDQDVLNHAMVAEAYALTAIALQVTDPTIIAHDRLFTDLNIRWAKQALDDLVDDRKPPETAKPPEAVCQCGHPKSWHPRGEQCRGGKTPDGSPCVCQKFTPAIPDGEFGPETTEALTRPCKVCGEPATVHLNTWHVFTPAPQPDCLFCAKCGSPALVLYGVGSDPRDLCHDCYEAEHPTPQPDDAAREAAKVYTDGLPPSNDSCRSLRAAFIAGWEAHQRTLKDIESSGAMDIYRPVPSPAEAEVLAQQISKEHTIGFDHRRPVCTVCGAINLQPVGVDYNRQHAAYVALTQGNSDSAGGESKETPADDDLCICGDPYSMHHKGGQCSGKDANGYGDNCTEFVMAPCIGEIYTDDVPDSDEPCAYCGHPRKHHFKNKVNGASVCTVGFGDCNCHGFIPAPVPMCGPSEATK